MLVLKIVKKKKYIKENYFFIFNFIIKNTKEIQI